MAYKPDPTPEENFPNCFEGFDPAEDPGKPYPPAEQNPQTRQTQQTAPSSTYNTSPS